MVDFDFGAYLPLSLGQVVATPGAIEAMAAAKITPMQLLVRHASGDWGDVCEDDREANKYAVIHGERVLSAYTVGEAKVWVITEWDRSVTTLLLPSEY